MNEQTTTERIGAFTAARLLWAWLSGDDAVWQDEWRTAWDELHVDDPTEDEAREDEVILTLVEWLASELVSAHGYDEAVERAKVGILRNADAARLLAASLGVEPAPWHPVDETVRDAG